MLGLRPYKACDAEVITRWSKDEYAFRLWSADRFDSYPLSPTRFNAYVDRDKGKDTVWGMTAFDESGVTGYLTMRYPGENRKEVRFGFVILDDQKRGLGYGRAMLSLAMRYAFDFIHADILSLGVFENNLPAIRCYRAAGFRPIPTDKPEIYTCMGERWTCIEMQAKRRDMAVTADV